MDTHENVDVLEAAAQAAEIAGPPGSSRFFGTSSTLTHWRGDCVGDDTSQVGARVLLVDRTQ